MRPTSYTGPGGVTYTADQVSAMLAAQRQQLGGAAPVVPATAVAKMFGTGVPPDIEASEALQQMTPGSPFSPGTPLQPFDGYSRTPRTRDFTPSVNVATRPRLHERVSFETLKGLIRAYDVAGMCIWHRIDTLRSVKYRLVPADGYTGDVTGAVELAKRVLRKPDGRHHFKNWLARWLYDVLAYDAGALYRRRNRAGRCIGLKTIDGTSLAPLLDYWGDEPEGPAPSHVQIANGLIWNWLTPDDLIYEPMRPVNDSIYGQPPIELILLNANTDIRFQIHFLQRFTEGNIPEAFASAPESWTPDQIELFQGYWDSFMYGDQARKHQVRWMPGGSTISWTNERDFTDEFSLFMMRKTCASFHVVPTDLGFTDSSNYSTGESQADVAHKAGELPLMEYTEEILSQFLYDDIQVPVKFEWDRGEDQDDRLVQAQSDQIYIQSAVVDADEIREMRFGLPIDPDRRVGRIFFTERGGPIPLNSFLALAGKIDPETAAPAADAALPATAFSDVEGVISNPPVLGTPLAVEEYGPGALPPMPPSQPMPADEPPGADGGTGSKPVAKEGESAGGGPAAGITADTGLYGDPLMRDDDEDDPKSLAPAAKAASGYDLSPRSGMISLDLPDGVITPVPGGVTDFHVTVVYLGPDVDDDAFAAACGRAQEAAAMVPGPLDGTVSGVGCFAPSDSSDGKTPAWAAVAVPGAEILRDTLGDLSASEHTNWMPHVTLAYVDEGDPLPAPLPDTPVRFTHLSVHRGDQVWRFALGGGGLPPEDADEDTQVAKAVSTDPKVQWPGWELDLPAADYWAKQITAALSTALTGAQAIQLANAYAAENPDPPQPGQKREAVAAAAAWLATQGLDLSTMLLPLVPGILADGYLIGAVSAAVMTDGGSADTGGWKPGDTQAAQDQVNGLGLGAGLGAGLTGVLDAADSVANGYLTVLGRALVDGAIAGSSAAVTGATITAALASPVLAAGVALGQIVAAVGLAAMAWYRRRKVKYVEWLTDPASNSCPACIGNEADGRIPLGEPFSSGDTSAPAHPQCRCETVPAS